MLNYCLLKQNESEFNREIHFELNEKNVKMKKREKVLKFAKRYVVPSAVILVSVLIPVSVFGEEISGVTKVNPSKEEKQAKAVESLFSIRKCLDPCATPIEKLHSCLKPCCAITFLASGYVCDKPGLPPKLKAGIALCCTLSWGALAVLETNEAFFKK